MDIDVGSSSITFHDVHKHFKSLNPSQLSFITQVVKVVKFVLLMLAINAVSERSASAVQRLKTYLRAE